MVTQVTNSVEATLREADIASRLSAIDSGTGWTVFITNASDDMRFLLGLVHDLRQENVRLETQGATVTVPVLVRDELRRPIFPIITQQE